jgi:pimeloyl-ACP methyl ester carboxylesterase
MAATIPHVGTEEVVIPVGRASLAGTLAYPENPCGLVVFAHGSGSSRLSVRNNRVAAQLRRAGLGTLLFDLLMEDEARSRANVFDIPLLADRLEGAATWLRSFDPGMPIGVFGASTGAAAALVAAAQLPGVVRAVVSRGGRPDLAWTDLPRVKAPTLLIVGGNDPQVLVLNRQAYAELPCEKRLVVVPGAGHLFEEGQTMEEVSSLARHWFVAHLPEPLRRCRE